LKKGKNSHKKALITADYRLPNEVEWEYAAWGIVGKGKKSLDFLACC